MPQIKYLVICWTDCEEIHHLMNMNIYNYEILYLLIRVGNGHTLSLSMVVFQVLQLLSKISRLQVTPP